MNITVFDETGTRVGLLKLTVPPLIGDILHLSSGKNESASFKVTARTCYAKDMSAHTADHDDVASWELRVERLKPK
jgi:hypothetical protein